LQERVRLSMALAAFLLACSAAIRQPD